MFQALNGQRAQFMERGSRDAVRDVATLWYLFVEVNARFLAEKRALWLQLAYLASSYARWISDIGRGQRPWPNASRRRSSRRTAGRRRWTS